MMVAPYGFERFPLLVNPLLVPDQIHPMPELNRRAVESVEPIKAADLHLEVDAGAGQPVHAAPPHMAPERAMRLGQTTNPKLLAETTPSRDSVAVVAGMTARRATASEAIAAYEHTTAAQRSLRTVELA